MTEREKKQLGEDTVKLLCVLYPDAACALLWQGEAWKLLVMGRLSAQCTDRRVNIVCGELFTAYKTPQELAEAEIADIERIIRPCGLYHTKAADIKGEMQMLCGECAGVLPDSMDKLLAFPGVGRKIANLLLGDIFGQPAVVTDTHFIRICGRLGFYPEEMKDPGKIEKIMREYIAPEEQSGFCHRIVQFGRDCCTARSPHCTDCPAGGICRHKNTEKPQLRANIKTKGKTK